MLRHASLFTGIGGFDLAAEWVGWENIFQVEIDEHCQSRLKKLFPNVKKYRDVKEFSGKKYTNHIDVLSGGDPCQPSSVAGLGKGTKDDRYLWPEMFRIAEELQVPCLINENVSGSIANGILDIKIDDLESIGYSCQPYCIPAESVGGLHQRERVWLVAYNPDFHRNIKASGSIPITKGHKFSLEEKQHKIHKPWQSVNLWDVTADSNIERFQELNAASESANSSEGLSRYFGFGTSPHGNIPRNVIESGIIRMLDGLPEGMDYADRNQRIKALGNAVVPEVVYVFFSAIDNMFNQFNPKSI